MRLSNEKKITNDFFKIKPNNFIIYMNKNGIIKQDDVENFRNILNNYEYYKDHIDTNLIDLFKPLSKYNIDNIYYIILIHNLKIQQIKNLYRFLNIKLNLIKDKVSYNIPVFNLKLDDIMSITNLTECKNIIYSYLLEFIDYSDFNFLFFINILHEYFAPNINM